MILGGCALIVYTTTLLSAIAALYVAGGMLVILGVLMGLHPGRER